MKSMYSLMLSEAVVNEIDALARKNGKTRSALVNEILAEYVSFVTPEKRINDIFVEVERLFSAIGLPVNRVGRENVLSVKRELEYPYRPTVSYEVELLRVPTNDRFGALRVGYRTTSIKLLSFLLAFFDEIERVEEEYGRGRGIDYEISNGCWTRDLLIPRVNVDLGRAITDYVDFLDRQMKRCLAQGSIYGLDEAYIEYKNRVKTII